MNDFPYDALAKFRLEYCRDNDLDPIADLQLSRLLVLSFDELVAATLDGSIEGLKRSLFYIWFSQVEPPYLTGFRDFEKSKIVDVLNIFYELLDHDDIDSELITMTSWYDQVAGWVFDSYLSYPINYHDKVSIISNASLEILDKSQFRSRGLMSIYFESLQFTQ